MDSHIFEFLEEYYASPPVKAAAVDPDGRFLWSNDADLKRLCLEIGAPSLFHGGKIPDKEGIFPVTAEGISCLRVRKLEHYRIILLESFHDGLLVDLIQVPAVREAIQRMSAKIRTGISGITTATGTLHEVLEEEGRYSEIGYLNLQMGNCYEILSAVHGAEELLHYFYPEGPETAEEGKKEVLDLSSSLRNAEEQTRKIFGPGKCPFSFPKEDQQAHGLYIHANPSRFTGAVVAALLCLTANGGNPRRVTVGACQTGEDVALSFQAEGPWEATDIPLYSEWIHSDEKEAEIYLKIVQLFCQRFGGVLMLGREQGELSSLILRFPAALREKEQNPSLHSPIREYGSDKFSPWHIAFAHMAGFPFFYSV